jgi:hypothetical protein
VPRVLVQDAGLQALPAVSPDGRWLAYSSDESGTWQVYVRPFPDASSAKWQVSVLAGYAPVWARSGRELFFLSQDSMYVADVAATRGFSAGIPRALFPTGGLPALAYLYDVSPDARRFLFVRYENTESLAPNDEMVLVQNFAAELRAKVPRGR